MGVIQFARLHTSEWMPKRGMAGHEYLQPLSCDFAVVTVGVSCSASSTRRVQEPYDIQHCAGTHGHTHTVWNMGQS